MSRLRVCFSRVQQCNSFFFSSLAENASQCSIVTEWHKFQWQLTCCRMVTVFNPTETPKRPSAVLLFKTCFFPLPGAPSSPSGLFCSFVEARTSEWGLVLERTRECFSAYSALLEPVHRRNEGIDLLSKRKVLRASLQTEAPLCRVLTGALFLSHLKTAKWMRTCQFLNKWFESPFNVLFRTPQGNISIHTTSTGSHKNSQFTRSNSFDLFLVSIFCLRSSCD